jgi:hypothetical protein
MALYESRAERADEAAGGLAVDELQQFYHGQGNANFLPDSN